jgi:sugar phosphate isomerase/epimerase
LEECVDAAAHLAKQVTAPILVIEAAASGSPMEQEIVRLRRLVGVAALHGTTLTVATKSGTVTEMPQSAVDLCQNVEGLGLTLDPSHYICGPNQCRPYEQVYPYVKHTHLRDSGRRIDQIQITVGRGEIEYGRIINSLCRFGYRGALTVAMEDQVAHEGFETLVEARKLRLLLESYLIQRDAALFRAA